MTWTGSIYTPTEVSKFYPSFSSTTNRYISTQRIESRSFKAGLTYLHSFILLSLPLSLPIMAFLTIIIASFSAFLASFLSISPATFHGLVPWMNLAHTLPLASTPSVVPMAFSALDFWEATPVLNLSAPDALVLPPPPTFFILSDAEDDKPFFTPEPEEPEKPTAESPFGELWCLLKQVVLHLTLEIHEFVSRFPFLRGNNTVCSLRRLWWRRPPLSRPRVRGRSLLGHLFNRGPQSERVLFPFLQYYRPRALACASSAALSSQYPPTSSPPASPAPSPLFSPSSASNSACKGCRTQIAELTRHETERRMQQTRIVELEEEVNMLRLQVQNSLDREWRRLMVQ